MDFLKSNWKPLLTVIVTAALGVLALFPAAASYREVLISVATALGVLGTVAMQPVSK